MELQSILQHMSDGEFHSGADLGRALGVSRTAIWKTLGQLEALGLSVESIKGKGYRLGRALDLLDLEKICEFIGKEELKKLSMELSLELDSTNSYLMSARPSGALYDCCLAEFQKLGRGRRGRSWVSPFASNLYMSVAFDLDGGADALSGLSLVVGLSVVKTLGNMGVEGVELKWPNDVWLNGRKLAGILVELSGEATTSWRVVVGLGLNVDMVSADAEKIDQPWACLSEVLDSSRSEIAGLLINGLIQDFEIFKDKGFSAFVSDWARHDALFGKQVLINGGVAEGVARGVDAGGSLLVEMNGVLSAVNAGEVTVRCV